jgi:hypothetical protein
LARSWNPQLLALATIGSFSCFAKSLPWNRGSPAGKNLVGLPVLLLTELLHVCHLKKAQMLV